MLYQKTLKTLKHLNITITIKKRQEFTRSFTRSLHAVTAEIKFQVSHQYISVVKYGFYYTFTDFAEKKQ